MITKGTRPITPTSSSKNQLTKLRTARTDDELTRLYSHDFTDTGEKHNERSEKQIKDLRNLQEHAFSSPMKLICSGDQDTRKERLKSATRYPAKSIFNLTDSKANLVSNASKPRQSVHIYKL